MSAYGTVEQAQADVDKMLGWINPHVVVEPEPDIAGQPIIYIRATDPQTHRDVIWTSPDQSWPDDAEFGPR